MTTSHLLSQDQILPFLLGGKAVFTIVNKVTGNRGTFRVDVVPTGYAVRTLTGTDNSSRICYTMLGYITEGQWYLRSDAEVCSLLHEAITESGKEKDKWLLSFLESWADFRNRGVKPTVKMRARWGKMCRKFGIDDAAVPDSLQEKIFVWTWNRLHSSNPVLPTSIEVWHEGLCSHCARKLTVPASIQLGLGPDCAEKFGKLPLWLELNAKEGNRVPSV